MRETRDALLGVLTDHTDAEVAAKLVDGLARLDPTAEDNAKPATRCSGC